MNSSITTINTRVVSRNIVVNGVNLQLEQHGDLEIDKFFLYKHLFLIYSIILRYRSSSGGKLV